MPSANLVRQKIDSHATGRAWIRAEAADMRVIYANARARLMERITKLAMGADAPFTGKHLVRLNEEIQRQFASLEMQLRAEMRFAVPYVAQSYYMMALADAGSKVLGRFSQSRLDAMLDDAYRHIAGATQRMTTESIRHLRSVSAEVFRESALTGETRREVSRRLMSKALQFPDFAFIDKAGRQWGNRAYFDMLGRTVLLNSSRSAYLDTCADKGKDVVVVSTSGNPCPACAVWERRLLSISGQTPDLPTLQEAIDRGLFHPNCTHSITAVPNYSRTRRWDEDGRPNQGANSDGRERQDDAAAWKKYRQQ